VGVADEEERRRVPPGLRGAAPGWAPAPGRSAQKSSTIAL
jgi:hypothetical protein